MLSGWDRMVVRGTLRKLYYPRGMLGYLALCRILLKDFKAFTVGLTARILEAASEWAQRHRRPGRYLGSGKLCKERIAREIALADGVSQGAVALLRCVEQCQSYTVAGNRHSKKLELRFEPMRCQHLYFYQIHPVLGWMFVRVQRIIRRIFLTRPNTLSPRCLRWSMHWRPCGVRGVWMRKSRRKQRHHNGRLRKRVWGEAFFTQLRHFSRCSPQAFRKERGFGSRHAEHRPSHSKATQPRVPASLRRLLCGDWRG